MADLPVRTDGGRPTCEDRWWPTYLRGQMVADLPARTDHLMVADLPVRTDGGRPTCQDRSPDGGRPTCQDRSPAGGRSTGGDRSPDGGRPTCQDAGDVSGLVEVNLEVSRLLDENTYHHVQGKRLRQHVEYKHLVGDQLPKLARKLCQQ